MALKPMYAYIQDLVKQKSILVTALRACGLSASSSEKFNTLVPKVYQAYNSGQMSVISNSERLRGSVSGVSVVAADISPVSHTLTVKLSNSNAILYKSGKNLLDANKIVSMENVTDRAIKQNSFTARGNEGSNEYKFDAGQMLFPSSNVSAMQEKGFVVRGGVKHTLSFDALLHEEGKYSNRIQIYIFGSSTGTTSQHLNRQGIALEQGVNKRYMLSFTPIRDDKCSLCFRLNNNYITFSNIQIEEGEPTDFGTYVTTTEYKPNTNGTVSGVKSLYPSTVLTTNNPDVTISMGYFKDIDKAFAELEAQAVAVIPELLEE